MTTEWLETDHNGGYGMGSSDLVPTRRYHAFYIKPDNNSERRTVLFHTPLIEISLNGTWYDLSSFQYQDGTVHPRGRDYIISFAHLPWPTWEFEIIGHKIRAEYLLLKSQPSGFLRWTLLSGKDRTAALRVRPFLSMRDHHHLTAKHHYPENPMCAAGTSYSWCTSESSPSIYLTTSAAYSAAPVWYENFLYAEERNRGFDCREDLFSPGYFYYSDLNSPATLKISADRAFAFDRSSGNELEREIAAEIDIEHKRRAASSDYLAKASTDFKVRRNGRASIIAGYPWFSDWGRDTFISIRGLCYALDDFDFAKEIIFCWRETVHEGLIPNRFPDTAAEAEYNSIDATLWYLIAIAELLEYAQVGKVGLTAAEETGLLDTADIIVERLVSGTRYNIHVDDDGLLFAGEAGKQLTWMDAKIGDWVVTPRIGKPVEIQALWINALTLLRPRYPEYNTLLDKATSAFEKRFWLEDLGYLADVVDVDNQAGEVDIALRPNQIFALGGLPFSLLSGTRALRALKKIKSELLTEYGLRTLSPRDTRYRGSYRGDGLARDSAYHQGTVWPWLIGAYGEALLRNSQSVDHLLTQLNAVALARGGHVPEIFEADAPHHPVGAPCQAWSLAELVRLNKLIESKQRGVLGCLKKLF